MPNFDPLERAFEARQHLPSHLVPVEPAELSPLQRALLVTDGTVTTLLAAWALEPVTVRPLGQRTVTLGGALPPAAAWLDVPAGSPVVERAVLIEGATSGRLFAFAESLICADRLPEALRAGLASGEISLGHLLRLPGFESRREGLWYGREQPLALPPEIKARGVAEFLSRTYRVTAGSKPLMVITERFPWSFRA